MPRQPQEPGPEATLKRGNESVVAGLHCVDWSWTEDVETRTVCITADGVLLRFLVDDDLGELDALAASRPPRDQKSLVDAELQRTARELVPHLIHALGRWQGQDSGR